MSMSDDERHVPRNLFVTGGCGFIGSNFINYVFDKWNPDRIINIDKLALGATPDNIVDRVRKSDGYQFVHGNLLDIPLVQKLLVDNEIDTIIHFAAITHVDESYENRIGTIEENVKATTSLLESVNVAKSVRRFVHISTDEVYGDSHNDGEPKTETSLFNPTNPYAASKAACELIVKSYHHSYKLPYVMVRMNNVYGPRQAYSKLIPKFTKLAIEGKPYPLMGDGMHTRSWMFVDDCAEAIVRVTERGRVAECFNIGIEFEKANLHLTQMIHEIVGQLLHRLPTKPTFASIPDRPYHDRRYFIDFSKIRNQLSWECATPFVDGLTRTIEFYVEDHRRKTRAGERVHG